MKDWSELTEHGQIFRLRSLAKAALGEFPIEPRGLRLVGGFTNVIFRVDTDEGPYALRVDLHQDHSDADVEIELAWLMALVRDSDLDVVRVVPASDGRWFVHATGAGVPGMRRCVLFQWVPGRRLGDNPTENGYFRLGRMSGRLHLHGEHFVPPHRPLTWDKVFYWPEEVDPVVVFDPERSHYLEGGRRELLERSIVQVETAFAKLNPSEAQVIHGDLHPDNVHIYRSRLIGFDFEDVTWGHRVQDIAITLFYERDHPGYDDFRAAFEEGYRSVAAWPVGYEGELEHFMAARTIMFINYVANLHDDPSGYYKIAFPRLERFLETRSS
jgi:Ser/Thr protein kinase RdoA (MazF antagonist)